MLAPVAALAASANVSGTIASAAGAPVPGARVSFSGPSTVSVESDANGNFTASLPEGVYHVDVVKSGFNPAALTDYTVVAGSMSPLAITLTAVSLESLQTIAHVTAAARGISQINTGAATSSYVPAQAFSNLAAPQINDVLQQVPDVNIEHMGSQPDTTIVLDGAQPYETQVLIDGHPIALGQYGVWSSQFFPSWLIGGVETQSGPGNTTPFASQAVAGTVNLLTPGYTKNDTAELVVGTDNYLAQYSHLLTTGSAGHFSWVAGLGYGSYNGPYYQQTHCAVIPNSTAAANGPGNTGIVQFCGDTSGSLFQKGELLKMKYDFTPSTSFELGFVGAWGGYLPQGASYATFLGPTTIVGCLPSVPLACTNPANANLIGQTINGYAWYPGSNVYYNQPMFTAQLRTTIGSGTLLVRPYAGNIEPDVVDGFGEGMYPYFFSPVGVSPSLPNGATIPGGYLANPTPFENLCGSYYNQINSPSNTVTVVNGQEECYQYPFSEFEIDKLYGGTASFIQPIGDSIFNLTYDFHSTDTFAYYNAPTNIAVPDTKERVSTISLTGEVHVIPNLGINVGLYSTSWRLDGVTPELISGVPATNASGNTILLPLTRTVSKFDPHIAFVYRPRGGLSYRLSYGTSETFPYAGQLSGLPFYQPPSATTNFQSFLLVKNPFLNPETSNAWGIGVDKRFGNGSVLAFDLQDTIIRNVFEPQVLPPPAPNEIETETINIAQLLTQLATLKYTYAPQTGLGYSASATAARAIPSGIPAAVYASGAAFPENNVQICGNGLTYPNNPICIPYLKGYGQINYTWNNGTFVKLGVDYEGKNNSYFQPPFAMVDFTFRKPVAKDLELQVSVQNLLNTNNYGVNLPIVNGGVPLVAGGPTGQTTYIPDLYPAPPRLIRLQARLHVGR